MGFVCLENLIRKTFSAYGLYVGAKPLPFLLGPLFCTVILAGGLSMFNVDSDVGRLFTPHGAASLRELRMLKKFSRVDSSAPTDTNRRYVYRNFTCEPKTKNVKGKVYKFIPDFCQPDVICPRMDENLIKISKFLHLAAHGQNSNIRLTYPVMKVYGRLVNWGEFLQGVSVDPETNLVREAKLLIVPLQFQFNPQEIDVSTAHQCMYQLSHYFENLGTYRGVEVHTVFEQYFVDEVQKTQECILPWAALTVLLVAVFCILSTMEKNFTCKITESLMGLLTIGLSLISAFGLMLYLQSSYNFMISVTPFIVLCVGIDNDFLLMSAWRQSSPSLPSGGRLAESLAEAGPSLVITSLTDVLSFVVGCISGTPAVSTFCLFTAVSLAFRFAYQLTFFAAIMAYNGRRVERRSAGCNKFLTENEQNAKNCVENLEKWKKHQIFTKFHKICRKCGNFQCEKRTDSVDQGEYYMHRVFRLQWAEFITRRWVRLCITLAMFFYFFLCLFFTCKIQVNIKPQSIITDSSPMVPVFENAEKYFWPYNAVGHAFVLNPPDFRNATNRKIMADFVRTFESTKYFTPGTESTTLWFKDYMQYLNFFGDSADQGSDFNATDEQSGLFLAEFYIKLEDFFEIEENKKFVGDLHFKNTLVNFGEPNIENFQFRVFFQHVHTWNDHVELMLHWRRACAHYPQLDALVADHSSLNPYLDQRLSLGPTTMQTMGVALLCMTLVTTLLMPDATGIFFVTLSFISVDLGVVGLLNLWHCDLDPATLTGIVMSIGFSVYYTARVCFNYQCSEKSMDPAQRLSATMGAVGWPILQGGLGTAFGISALTFAQSYVARAFLKTIILVVLAGLLHGLFFVPLLLASFDCQPVRKNRRRALILESHVKITV